VITGPRAGDTSLGTSGPGVLRRGGGWEGDGIPSLRLGFSPARRLATASPAPARGVAPLPDSGIGTSAPVFASLEVHGPAQARVDSCSSSSSYVIVPRVGGGEAAEGEGMCQVAPTDVCGGEEKGSSQGPVGGGEAMDVVSESPAAPESPLSKKLKMTTLA
jgi:hypothetical protein